MDEGEAITDHDPRDATRVWIRWPTIIRELFAGQSPMGKQIHVQNVTFRVIVALSPKGANMGFVSEVFSIRLTRWAGLRRGTSLAKVKRAV